MANADACADAHIVITGPMGSGKTTVGRQLARRLHRVFFDSDVQIQERYGSTSGALAELHGVEWLHRAEAEALAGALQAETPAVVAAAASIGDLEDVGRLLGGDVVTVLLDGQADVLIARARTGPHRRRIGEETYRELTERRRRALADHVDVVVDVTTTPPGQVAEEILERCR